MIDVAVIGAGPYGLSVGAHLGAIRGLESRVFGEPMSFWRMQMPRGMLLRSPYSASHLSDPDGACTLAAYAEASGRPVPRPIPLDRFVDYGRWFQRKAVPQLDGCRVLEVRRENGAFRLILETGTEERARRVVIATGIAFFAHRPEPFQHLPSTLVSHSSEHWDLGRFAGRRVLVIGAGQSALESAALLREAGADVELIARRSPIRFLKRSSILHRLGPVSWMLYAPTDVGPAFVSRVVAWPMVFRRLPVRLREPWRRRCIRPAGAAWLLPRLQGVPLTAGLNVVGAEEAGRVLRLRLSDGSERCADHVLLATGYRCDINRYPFLRDDLLARVRVAGGFPVLNAGLESSVEGLHFVGGPAARSFGPLMFFVAGADFTARRLAASVSRNGRRGRVPGEPQ